VSAIRRLRSESGTSILEMVIVTLVLGIVVAVSIGAFVAVQRNVANEDIRLENLDEGRVMMATLSKSIRTATILTGGTSPFASPGIADSNRVKFYANLDTTGAPNLVEVYIDSTNPTAPVLVEKLTLPDQPVTDPPTYCQKPCTPTVRFVGRYVINGPTLPMFVYYDVNGAPVGSPNVPLTEAQKVLVRSVGISLQVKKATSQAIPSTAIVTRVRLPNVFYNVQSSPTP
jgi:type II secretory pathway pseudopilin PulG